MWSWLMLSLDIRDPIDLDQGFSNFFVLRPFPNILKISATLKCSKYNKFKVIRQSWYTLATLKEHLPTLKRVATPSLRTAALHGPSPKYVITIYLVHLLIVIIQLKLSICLGPIVIKLSGLLAGCQRYPTFILIGQKFWLKNKVEQKSPFKLRFIRKFVKENVWKYLLSICKESRCYVRLDFVRQFKSKKSCLTTFKSCDVWLGFSSTWKQQLSNIKLVELNQENNYVRFMLISTKAFFLSFF